MVFNELDSNIVVSEFEHQFSNYVPFHAINPLIPSSYELDNTTAVLL